MKTIRGSFLPFAGLFAFLVSGNNAEAQQYKLRQVTSMMSMKSESTIYVKGPRKRTEGGGFMGMGTSLVTIEQCDLQRTITINDKKKLYFIEPFAKETEEVIDEDAKVDTKSKPVAPATKVKDSTGGVIYMWYNITDTGERKKMFGFNARHVWTSQKMKPSPDACTMKDSMQIKTDGWYIDLPEFNCPIRYRPTSYSRPAAYEKPACKDRFVTRRRGKGKLGFPLVETTTMIMGSGDAQSSRFESNIETLELTTGKLDSMLFEIPPGYQLASSMDELQDKFDPNAYIKQYQNQDKEKIPAGITAPDQKREGVLRIGVFAPTGDEQVQGQAADLQQFLVGNLTGDKYDAVAVSSEEDARNKKCDLLLNTEITRFKQADKIGGLLKKIKNADPSAGSSFNIDAALKLTNISDGSLRSQQAVSGKYDGKPEEAAKNALQEGCRGLVKTLK